MIRRNIIITVSLSVVQFVYAFNSCSDPTLSQRRVVKTSLSAALLEPPPPAAVAAASSASSSSSSSSNSNSNSNNNIFHESMILLSRATEVTSTALSTAAPLLISGLSSNFERSTNSKSKTNSNNAAYDNNNDDDDDAWEQFWSMRTSKVFGFNIHQQDQNQDRKKKNGTRVKEEEDVISNAHRVVQALQKLGPTYVKFGQALASRPDIIPQSLANALTVLQDDMDPFDTNIAKDIITKELLLQYKLHDNKNIDIDNNDDDVDDNDDVDTHVVDNVNDIQSLIDSLSSQPVAAASVGQVYKGYLPNYGPVAVKVQRPGIKELVEKDFSLLRSFASFAESIPSFDFHHFNKNTNTNTNEKGSNTISNSRLINTELVAAVDEFMSRIFEELDYTNEAANAKTFADLYCVNRGSSIKSLPNGQGVIVPEIITSLCTKNVIVMEWIEGSKLTSIEENDIGKSTSVMTHDDGQSLLTSGSHSSSSSTTTATTTTTSNGANTSNVIDNDHQLKENLALVEQALYVTLSQLLDTGVMHADPHGGNLLKVSSGSSSSSVSSNSLSSSKESMPPPTLAYLDFGLLATIPTNVRDGLVCAVASLVFAKDVEAVASLFGELDLLPQEVIADPVERKALTDALRKTMEEVLKYPDGESLYSSTSSSSSSSSSLMSLSSLGQRISFNKRRKDTTIPSLEFDKLLDGLTRLVPRFKFRLPPYFINNARALGTLEGTARSLNPDFNCLQMMYPYALYRLLQNPTGSPVVKRTLENLIRSEKTGRVDREKVSKLLRDTAMFTGHSRRKVLTDIVKTRGGKRLIMQSLASEFNHLVLQRIIRRSKRFGMGEENSAYFRL